MKTVVHISTSDKIGGAAIAAWRLHRGLKLLDMDSRMVCLHRSDRSLDVSQISTPFVHALDLFHQQRVLPTQLDPANYFSVSPISVSLLEHPWIAAADIIHLHWVARFLAPEDIAALCDAGKTVFWTLHDQWAYTGGCHYVGGKSRTHVDWEGSLQVDRSMRAIVEQEFQRKTDAFKGRLIHVIAPSRWMAEEAAQSGVFTKEQIQIVPYGIDTTVFHPAPARDTDTPSERVGLLFGCQNLQDRRKGFSELKQALVICMQDNSFADAVASGWITLTTFGYNSGVLGDLPMPAIHLLSLEKETEVAKALRAASCLICPTLEDNLPNVVLEALACGCPVLAFSTGGIPDMVTHGQKGLLTPKGDVLGLARLILEFCSNRTLREDLKTNVRSIDLASFALETQASTLRKLYQTAAFVKTAVPLELDPLPFQTVEVKLIQHFGTEIVAVLLEEKARNKLTQSATIAELRWDLARAGEKITEADRATEEAEKKLLMEEVSTTNLRDALESSEFKIGNALRKLTNLTSKLQAQKRVSCHLKKLSERRTINGQTRRLFRWLSGKR